MLAGLLIAMVPNLVLLFMIDFGGLEGLLVRVAVAAGAICACGRLLPGLNVKGFTGALVASVAMSLISFGLVFLTSAVVAA
jgi:uncharacterized membrane protein YvlD (DUF360 family)